MRKSAPLFCALLLSLSARRAWIENFVPFDVIRPAIVALRKESVDRKVVPSGCWLPDHVALRKESVDRKVNLRVLDGSKSSSLSARRAWIEKLSGATSNVWTCSRSPQGERG